MLMLVVEYQVVWNVDVYIEIVEDETRKVTWSQVMGYLDQTPDQRVQLYSCAIK